MSINTNLFFKQYKKYKDELDLNALSQAKAIANNIITIGEEIPEQYRPLIERVANCDPFNLDASVIIRLIQDNFWKKFKLLKTFKKEDYADTIKFEEIKTIYKDCMDYCNRLIGVENSNTMQYINFYIRFSKSTLDIDGLTIPKE